MKKNYLSLMMLLLILSWLLGACQKQPVSTMPTEVSSITSLKKYLAELESAAKEWQEDAYLINANLVISVPPGSVQKDGLK